MNGKRDITGTDLVNAALEFDSVRNRISDGTLLPPGVYAALLSHFSPVSLDQLALALMVHADEVGGGGGALPDPLIVGTLQATAQVQVPNGVAGTPALQIGTGQYGFYRTGTSIIVNTGGITSATFTPIGLTLGAVMNASNNRITTVADPTADQDAANRRWCLATFAPVVEMNLLRAQIAALEARLATVERRLP